MIKPTKEFLEIFRNTNGALSVAESIAIMNIAAQAPKGNYIYIEFGTYKGKSAMSASFALDDNSEILELEDKIEFILVDPVFKESLEWWFEVDFVVSFANKNVLPSYDTRHSIDVIPEFKDYAYVFIDSGSHGDGLPMQEVRLLEDRMVQGGIIAFHDFKSQFIEVEEAYNYLLRTDKYEEINIDWNEIVQYVDENNLEEGNISWHHNELKNPCFVGALRRK